MLRRIGLILVGALALVVLAIAGVFALAQAGAGKRVIADQLGRFLSGPDTTVRVHGLEGLVPFDFRLQRVSIADAEGPWLELDDAAIAWSPAALLRGRLEIDEIAARRLALLRLPRSEETEETGPLPELPRAIPPVVIRELRIDELELGQAVLGERAVFMLLGKLTTGGQGQAVNLTVDLDRIDDDTAHASLVSRLDLAKRKLAVNVTASETGGLLAAVTGLPDAGDFTLELAGDGSLDDWRGKLEVQGQGVARAQAQIALAVGDPIRVQLDSVLETAPGLIPTPADQLIGDRVTLALTIEKTDSGQLVVDRLQAAGALVDLAGSGHLDFATEQVVGQARLAISELAPLAAVLETPLAGSLSLAADVDGSLSQPKGQLTVEARDVEAAGLRAAQVQTKVDVEALENLVATDARVQVTAEGRAQGLVLPPEVPLPAQDVTWQMALTAPVDGTGAVAVDHLSVTADHAELTATGTVDATTLGGNARITLAIDSLRPFAEPYGQPFDGAAEVDADVALGADLELIGIDLHGRFRDLDGLPAGAAELLGAAPTLEANAILVPDDSVEITQLRVAGAAATLDGKLELGLPEQTLDGTLNLALPRLAVLAPVAGTELDGELKVQADLGGSLTSPSLRLDAQSPGLLVAGEHLDALALTASVQGPTDDLDGNLRLAVMARGLEAELATKAMLKPPALQLTDLTLTAPRTRIEGDLAIDLERALVDGQLTGRVQQLGAFAALLPVRLRGQAEIEARLAAENGAQTVALSARGSELNSDFGRLRRLDLQANVADALGTPQITADLTVNGFDQGEVGLTQGKITVEGTLAALNVTSSVTGQARFIPFTLDGRAGVSVGDQIQVRVEEFAGRVAEEPVNLAAPATITVANDRQSLEGLNLRLGGARLVGDFALGPREVAADMALDPLPLAMLGRFGGAPDLSGQLTARLSLQGPADNPSGSLEARATGVTMSAPTVAALPPAELTVTGTLQARRLRLDALGRGVTEQPIRLNAELPLVVNLASGVFEMPGEGQITGRLDADVRLALLADVLDLDDQRLEGPLVANLTISGTVAQPDLNGSVRIDQALYENGTTGTVLRDLTLRVRATRQTIVVERLSATDGGSGRLTGEGSIRIDPAAAYRVDLRVRLDRARLLARDDVTATASGDLTLDGTVAAPTLGGQITVNRAEISIPERIGPSVAVISVEEVGGNVAATAEASGDGAGPGFDLGLNVTVSLPGQVFVRGRGLDSEWEGRLRVEGTVAEPRVTGNLQVRRGGFELLGQRFDLRSGTIEFAGETPPNPMIDVQAVTTADDITAVVRVEGDATAPEFKLDSEPSMPEDEIVSRLLFNRAAGGLGPGDAIKLAAAVNTLRGGGLGVLGQARQALGLDTLGVSGEGIEDGRVRAGKYLNDRVYVEVGKGAADDSEDVRVEVEILPNLTLDADTDANAQSGIGLKWRFDY